jgi:hypothetical protein
LVVSAFLKTERPDRMALRKPLDVDTRAKLAELLKTKSEREMCTLLGGISSETLARGLAGLPIQLGSAELFRAGVARIAHEELRAAS